MVLKCSRILHLLFYVFLGGFYLAAANTVVTLTDDTFDELTARGGWLIKFYAPWCGHCQTLAPVFEGSARMLDSQIKFGEVDCTVQTGLCSRFDVHSYPTIRFWRDGESRAYTGGRDYQDFAKFARTMSSKEVSRVDNSTILFHLRNTQLGTFLYLGDKGPQRKVYHRVARRLQGLMTFLQTSDKSLVEAYMPSAVPIVLAVGDGLVREYNGEFVESELRLWVEAHRFRLLTELDGTTFTDIVNFGKQICIAAYNPTKSSNDHAIYTENYNFLLKIKDIAIQLSSDFLFAKIDAHRYAKYLENFNVYSDELPALFVLDSTAEVFWTVPLAQSSSDGKLISFLNQVHEGLIEGSSVSAWSWRGISMKIRNLSLLEGFVAFATILMFVFFVTALAWPVMPSTDESVEYDRLQLQSGNMQEQISEILQQKDGTPESNHGKTQ